MANPRISAIICTYNRSRYARKAIEGLLEQTLPPAEYEVILVDNNSTDDTRKMVESIDHPVMRYCFEKKQGLSHARNRGARDARSDVVAFLDDDGLPVTGWLEAILEVFEGEKIRPGAVGGAIELDWELPEPEWVSPPLLGELGALDWGREKAHITGDQWLCGGNLALCKQALFAVGGFPTSLGRTGKAQATYEETYVVDQFLEKGLPCWYQPTMRMYHTVMAERICRSWFRERFHGKGRSLARKELLERPLPYRKRCGKAWGTIKRILRDKATYRALFHGSRTAGGFRSRIGLSHSLGYIRGLLGI